MMQRVGVSTNPFAMLFQKCHKDLSTHEGKKLFSVEATCMALAYSIWNNTKFHSCENSTSLGSHQECFVWRIYLPKPVEKLLIIPERDTNFGGSHCQLLICTKIWVCNNTVVKKEGRTNIVNVGSSKLFPTIAWTNQKLGRGTKEPFLSSVQRLLSAILVQQTLVKPVFLHWQLTQWSALMITNANPSC